MEERRSITVTMPKDMYDRFVKDAIDNYDNCYWLKIAADEKIYKGIYDAVVNNTNIPSTIDRIRKELIDLTHARYDEDVKVLKRKLARYEQPKW